jgi:hypothetical protein
MGISGELKQITEINAYVAKINADPNKPAAEKAVDLAPVSTSREIINTAITNEKAYQQKISSGFVSLVRKITQA